HRHRDLARAAGLLGLAARLGPVALHARRLDRERLRLRAHHLRRVLHRSHSLSFRIPKERTMSHRALPALAAAAALALAGAARPDAPAAQVVALEGHATADAAALALGDSIVAGSVVRTGADSRIGFLASQIYVQLDPQSALKLERDPSGHVRM